jgi:hypothetical protein
MLVVDPWHWLEKDGSLPLDDSRLRRRVLRVARFIEYGAELERGSLRETLLECTKRPGGKPCPGLMWVMKTASDELLGFCMACRHEELLIHNWQKTEWAEGMMPPVEAQTPPQVLN